jgi:hypothetical protein
MLTKHGLVSIKKVDGVSYVTRDEKDFEMDANYCSTYTCKTTMDVIHLTYLL